MGDKLSAEQKQARQAGALARFVQQYGHGTRAGLDPNDRRHDRDLEARIKRMRPEELDRMPREDEAQAPSRARPALFAFQASTGTGSSTTASFASDGS